MTYDYSLKEKVIKSKLNKKCTNKQILDIFEISNGSLYNWVNQYKKNKLSENKLRKCKIKPHIKCFIRQYVLKKINFKYLNLIKLIKSKYDISLSKSSIYNVLSLMDIRKKKIYKREILTKLSKRKKQIKEFKKKLKGKTFNEVISMDECSVDSHINHNSGWGLRGQKLTIIKKHKRVRYTVICAISNNRIIYKQIINGSANAIIFLDFMKNLFVKLSPDKKFCIILDNARIHHSKIFKTYMETQNNIELIYNVPYSPESNPIEKVFSESKKYIKDKNINNKNIIKEINRAFSKVKKVNINNYFQKSLNFY